MTTFAILSSIGPVGCAFTPSPTVWEMYKEDPELYRNRIVLRPLDISNNQEVIRRLGVISMNTPLEFDILCLLAQNPGKVFSTDEIFKNVWNETVYEANNTVMVHIRRLRTKIKDDKREDKIITTVWGVGYKIDQ